MNIDIRPLIESDAKEIWRGWQQADIRNSISYEHGEMHLDQEEANAFVYFARAKGENGRDMAIECDGCFAGCVMWQYGRGLFQGIAEIGYWVLPEFRHQQCAQTAIVFAQDFLLRIKQIHRIQARTSEHNIASHRALLATGFYHEATLHDGLWLNDQWMNCEIFAYLS